MTWHCAGVERAVSSIRILSSLRLQYSFRNREQESSDLWTRHEVIEVTVRTGIPEQPPG